jgi:hypothetical protein
VWESEQVRLRCMIVYQYDNLNGATTPPMIPAAYVTVVGLVRPSTRNAYLPASLTVVERPG